ncbi:unnamed protein product [Caenorhabditis angaria]|uniref:Rho-GAP domain-containing protein n=1 Tax=Caenorhabditis angaria TaxID=860376 RepID=A0A9P1I591_9PELO|nr:unnamed protein product [Caenorhabditis angaria]
MHHDTSKDHQKKKKLKLTRKSTRKMLGKWSRMNSENAEEDEVCEKIVLSKPQKLMGIRLSEAFSMDPSLDGIQIPSFFRIALDFIEEHGLAVEGIYRLSPPKNRLDELERRVNCIEPMIFADVHDATGIIKRFLRQIPEPIVPPEFELIAESCDCGLSTANHLTPQLYCQCGAVQTMRQSLNCMEPEKRTLFVYVFLHAQNVMRMEKENKMGLAALGLLLQTILEMSRKLVCFTIHAIRPIFDDPSCPPDSNFLIDNTVKIKK